MKKWLLLIVTLIILFPLQTIFADNEGIGWDGYDICILNNFDAKISSKNVKIEIEDDKLIFNGEYVITNKSEKIVEVVLGLPSENVDNLSISDKGNTLKFYKRNTSYIEKNYIYEHLPKAEKWATVSLWLKGNESRIINIKYDSKVTNDSKGIYKIRYSNLSELFNPQISKTLIIFNDFKPYNIFHTSDIEVERTIYSRGSQLVFEVDDNSNEIQIDYELTDKLAVDRLDFSSSKKLKNIANLFRVKDYEAVITSCDEYLANPSDTSLDIAQVKYIKAEALRKIVRFDEYLEIIKTIDLNKLYPERLKLKILFDIDEILNEKVDDPKIFDILNTLQKSTLESEEFLGKWMMYCEKDYVNTNHQIETKEPKDGNLGKESLISKYISLLKLNKVYALISRFKYLDIIVVVAVFFIGFFLGRKSKKKKSNIPYYTFRR